jgi:hypothetical protein
MDRKDGLGKILIGVGIVAIVSLGGLIGARMIIAPSFSAVAGDYRYQWHRVANEQEWKDIAVKHQGNSYCKDCHSAEVEKVAVSAHAKVLCETCHGPAYNHPADPKKLSVDKGRHLCLPCHSNLPYRPSAYNELPVEEIRPQPVTTLKMINPDDHNPDLECVACHDPHRAEFK